MKFEVNVKEMIGVRKRTIFSIRCFSIDQAIKKLEEKFQNGR